MEIAEGPLGYGITMFVFDSVCVSISFYFIFTISVHLLILLYFLFGVTIVSQ